MLFYVVVMFVVFWVVFLVVFLLLLSLFLFVGFGVLTCVCFDSFALLLVALDLPRVFLDLPRVVLDLLGGPAAR